MLALELGWSHAQVQDLGHDEFVRWQAFFTWRAVQQQHQADVMADRLRR